MNKKGHKRSRGDVQLRIIQELEELWLEMPSLRFMQFIENVTGCAGGANCDYYMEDSEFERRLIKFSRHNFTDNYNEKNSPVH